ncbi:MAG TPA: alginate lyase family protein [Terracidiphilus sp.]|nr:alginate lyase family protein [Terracidiphilus sp.]
MPRGHALPLFLLAIPLLAFVLPARAARVRSPWDGHPIPLTDAPAACPQLPDLPPGLTTDGFYRLDDPTHSIIDPVRQKAYIESSGPIKHAAQAIVDEADTFRTTGSRAAAICALNMLAQMARNRTLTGHMSSQQAYYVQGWLAGAMAVAWLKVRDSGLTTRAEKKAIPAWLSTLANASRAWFDEEGKHNRQRNNHLYWAGAEMAAIAAAANRRDLLDWAIAAYREGIVQIQSDGTLPLEMARGRRALHYHLYALTPLVFIAEFGEANGIDLYAEHGHAIARLARICVHGYTDPSLFAQRTGIAQEVPSSPTAEDAYWARPYSRRFPSPELAAFLARAQSLSMFYLGGLPPE